MISQIKMAIGKKQSNVKMFLKKESLIVLFVLLLLVFSLFSDSFLTLKNIRLVFRQVSILGILSCGMTIMLISGNFDLSVGSIVSLTAVIMVDLHDKIGPVAAVLITLLVGFLIGCINGTFVGFLKLNSMIMTLGMLFIVQAVTFIYTKGYFLNIPNAGAKPFAFIGRGFVFGIPFPVIIFLCVLVMTNILLTKTTYGKYIYSIGGNKVASRYAGIRVGLITFSTFLLTSLTASIGGIIFASRLMAAQNTIGNGMEFEAITAVALGGTSIYGGRGSVLKTLIGVLILGFIYNAFILFGLPHYISEIVGGIIIIVAVGLDNYIQKELSY